MASQSDERFDHRPRTANEKLLNDWLKHQHYVERLTSGEARRVREFLRGEVLPDLIGSLTARLERIQARGFDTGVERTRRWQQLVDGFSGVLDDGLTAARKMSTAGLQDLAKYEAKWSVSALAKAIPGEVGVDFAMPTSQVLKELVTERPIAGFNQGEWWDKLTVDSINRVEREVRVGLAEGQSVPDIARRIRGTVGLKGTDGVFEITNRHAQGLVRNSATHVTSQVDSEVAKANTDVIQSEIWRSTLDLRTCPRCGALDGQEFPIGEGPHPPAHPTGPGGGACRCRRRPRVKSLSEILAATGAKVRVRDFQPSTRASMDGQVPDALSYSEWLRTLEPEELSEALGATRARLFTAGELGFDRMVDQSGRILTLEQIAKREGLEL